MIGCLVPILTICHKFRCQKNALQKALAKNNSCIAEQTLRISRAIRLYINPSPLNQTILKFMMIMRNSKNKSIVEFVVSSKQRVKRKECVRDVSAYFVVSAYGPH